MSVLENVPLNILPAGAPWIPANKSAGISVIAVLENVLKNILSAGVIVPLNNGPSTVVRFGQSENVL